MAGGGAVRRVYDMQYAPQLRSRSSDGLSVGPEICCTGTTGGRNMEYLNLAYRRTLRPRTCTDFGVYAELPAPDYVTFVFGPGSTSEHGQKLAEALRHIAL